MATDDLDWETREKLRKLDSKLNWRDKYIKDTLHSISYSLKDVYHDMNKTGVGIIAAVILVLGALGTYRELQKIPQTICQSQTTVDNQIESRYADLAERVAGKISILGSKEQDKRLCLGLIAASNTEYATELREKGYTGIVPLQPQEAGLEAAVLENDPEQCLMSAMGMINQIRIQQENKLETRMDFEDLITDFFYRAEQESFRDNPRKGDWAYIIRARYAYDHCFDPSEVDNATTRLQHHQRVLGVEAAIRDNPENEEMIRNLYERNGRSEKIKDPLELFYVKAILEAGDDRRSMDYHTWLELIPEDKAKPIRIILAYLNGLDINSGKKKDK